MRKFVSLIQTRSLSSHPPIILTPIIPTPGFSPAFDDECYDNKKIRALQMEFNCLRENITNDEIRQEFDRILSQKVCFKYPLEEPEVELENKMKQCRELLRKNNINIGCECAYEYRQKEKKNERMNNIIIGTLCTVLVGLGGYLVYLLYLPRIKRK